MVAARKGKKTEPDEPLIEPFIEDVSLSLADRPLPKGLYGNQTKIQLPHNLATVFGAELVPYLALLHDINILVREWNVAYRQTLKAVIEKKDYTDVVDSIMDRRHERDCPHCGYAYPKQITHWSPKHDPEMRHYRLECPKCGGPRWNIRIRQARRRSCPMERRSAV